MRIYVRLKMWRYIVCLGIIYLMAHGCDQDDGTGNPIGVDISSSGKWVGTCCVDTFFAYFNDDTNFGIPYYYWIGLKLNGRLVKGSNPMAYTPPFTNKLIAAPVSYRDNLAAGWYDLYVYSASSLANVWIEDSSISRDGGMSYYNKDFSGTGINCHYECCTGGYGHAIALVRMQGAEKVKAKMETRYGALCGTGYRTDTTHTAVWITIFNEDLLPTESLWVQTGFINVRNLDLFPGQNMGISTKYFEIKSGSGIQQHRTDFSLELGNLPVEGVEYAYEVYVDTITGVCYASFDNQVWTSTSGDSLLNQNWIGRTSSTVQFGGEVLKYETDMAGTYSDKCSIYVCSVYVGGSYQVVDFSGQNAFLLHRDLSEWEIMNVTSNSLVLWDKNPL